MSIVQNRSERQIDVLWIKCIKYVCWYQTVNFTFFKYFKWIQILFSTDKWKMTFSTSSIPAIEIYKYIASKWTKIYHHSWETRFKEPIVRKYTSFPFGIVMILLASEERRESQIDCCSFAITINIISKNVFDWEIYVRKQHVMYLKSINAVYTGLTGFLEERGSWRFYDESKKLLSIF